MEDRIKRAVMVEQVYPCPKEELWDAITNPEKMQVWFFGEITTFRAEKGFKTAFDVDAGNRTFTHQWEILEVLPLKKIVYGWSYAGYPGYSVVTFDISRNLEGSKLILTHDGVDTFPQDIPEFTPESCRQGWEYFIRSRLKEFLT